MPDQPQWQKDLYQDVQSLLQASFPKKCGTCGRMFQTLDDFLEATLGLGAGGQFMNLAEADGGPIIDLFRNCPCGSTLMVLFKDRRDTSDHGQLMRDKFGRLLDQLIEHGLTRQQARDELLRILHGKPSELLATRNIELDL